MKQLILSTFVVALLLLGSCKGDMYDDIKEHVSEETVYPGKLDFAKAQTGYERVEIDLLEAGRILSSQIHLKKAKKTVVEYDDREIVIDSVCSWVNVTGLSSPRLYRFKIATMDEFGNKSIPVETTATPFTATDKAALAVVAPKTSASSSIVVVECTPSPVLFNYYGLSYSYTDKDGTVHEGQTPTNKFRVENLDEGQTVPVGIRYKVIPKKDNKAIIDTVWLESSLSVKSLTAQEFDNIKNSFKSRGISKVEFTEENTATIYWQTNGSTILYTDVRYQTFDGTTADDIRVLPAENSTVLTNVKQSPSAIEYSSTFLYAVTGETFSAGWTTYR